MATELGTAYFNIAPNASGIQGKMASAIGGEGEASGKSFMSKFGKTAIKLVGAIGIGKAIKSAIDVGADMEQNLGGVETLFGKSADMVIKNADNAYKTAGLSANKYMEQSTSFASALLQSTAGDTRKAAKYADVAIKDMSDNANKFGTDIESIQNAYQGFAKQNYTMLDNLKLGYGGTKGEMERLLKDASKISGQKYDISSLSDVYSAIHVIQNELGVTGTTAMEASSTISGSFSSMKSAAENFLGDLALGRNLNESLSQLIDSSITFLIGNLAPAIIRVVASIPTALASALPTIASKLENGAEFIDKMIENGSSSKMGDTAVKIITTLGNALLKNLPRILTAIGSIVAGIGRMIIINAPKLVTAFLSAGTKAGAGLLMGIRGALGSIMTVITTPIRNAINKAKTMFSNIRLKLGGIKLPHLQVNWEKLSGWKQKALEKLGLQGLPTLGVNWYAKGGIFSDPSLIGVGEAGSEAVVPLDAFWKKMDAIAMASTNNNNGGELNLIIQLDSSVIAKSTIEYINGQTVRYGTSPVMT